jgi:hypothetical protein
VLLEDLKQNSQKLQSKNLTCMFSMGMGSQLHLHGVPSGLQGDWSTLWSTFLCRDHMLWTSMAEFQSNRNELGVNINDRSIPVIWKQWMHFCKAFLVNSSGNEQYLHSGIIWWKTFYLTFIVGNSRMENKQKSEGKSDVQVRNTCHHLCDTHCSGIF